MFFKNCDGDIQLKAVIQSGKYNNLVEQLKITSTETVSKRFQCREEGKERRKSRKAPYTLRR